MALQPPHWPLDQVKLLCVDNSKLNLSRTTAQDPIQQALQCGVADAYFFARKVIIDLIPENFCKCRFSVPMDPC